MCIRDSPRGEHRRARKRHRRRGPARADPVGGEAAVRSDSGRGGHPHRTAAVSYTHLQYIQYVTELSQYDSVNTGIAVIPMAEYLNLMTTVGASGAIYGILLSFGMLFPNSQMFVFPLSLIHILK